MKKLNILSYLFLIIFSSLNVNPSCNINNSIVSNIEIKKVNVNGDSYNFNYSVSPISSNASINYELTSINTGIDPYSYYSVSLNNELDSCLVTNLKACGYQCVLTLYSGNVSKSINLDYQQKVKSITSEIVKNEGSYLDMSNTINMSVGSISYDPGDISNESYSYNQDFIDNCNGYFEDLAYYNYSSVAAGPSFSNYQASMLFIHDFYSSDYLESLNWVIESDEGVETNYSLFRLGDDDWLSQTFDGIRSVIDYSFTLDSINYTNSVGLKINSQYFD